MPTGCERTGLGLAVPDDAGHDQVRVVEGGAVGVDQRVPEFATFVDRPRGLGCDVARDPTGERELPEEPVEPLGVLPDVRVDLAVGSLEVRVGDDAGSAVPRTDDVHHVDVALDDHPVEVRVQEIETRGGPEVPEKAGLDVFGAERFAEQRIGEQIDLTDGAVVGGSPVRVDRRECLV